MELHPILREVLRQKEQGFYEKKSASIIENPRLSFEIYPKEDTCWLRLNRYGVLYQVMEAGEDTTKGFLSKDKRKNFPLWRMLRDLSYYLKATNGTRDENHGSARIERDFKESGKIELNTPYGPADFKVGTSNEGTGEWSILLYSPELKTEGLNQALYYVEKLPGLPKFQSGDKVLVSFWNSPGTTVTIEDTIGEHLGLKDHLDHRAFNTLSHQYRLGTNGSAYEWMLKHKE